MYSAWKRPHDLAEDACPECQGSSYVPAPIHGERIVEECPECEGTGKDATKKAA
jgi:DnaJ-class molecular chaperone